MFLHDKCVVLIKILLLIGDMCYDNLGSFVCLICLNAHQQKQHSNVNCVNFCIGLLKFAPNKCCNQISN